MSFHVEVVPPTSPLPVNRTAGDLPDPLEPLLVADAAAHALSEHGTQFRAGGFGDPDWKVDVETDLAVLLPQLDEAVTRLEAGTEAELSFYEQGIERTVYCAPDAASDRVELRCVSFGNWVPSEPTETGSRRNLLAALRALRTEVAGQLAVIWPELALVAPFPVWRSAGAG